MPKAGIKPLALANPDRQPTSLFVILLGTWRWLLFFDSRKSTLLEQVVFEVWYQGCARAGISNTVKRATSQHTRTYSITAFLQRAPELL